MIETALVYIFTSDEDKRFIGCGALVEGGFIATCRHVWRMATKVEGGERMSVVLEFPKIKRAAGSPKTIAIMVHVCDDGMPDLVLLTPKEVPIEAMPLWVARAPKYTIGPAFALAALPSRGRRDVRISGTISDHRSSPDDLQEFSRATNVNYWVEPGSSGAPMFLDQGMQLAGLLSLSDLSEIVDPQAGLLREAFVVPGDIVWTHVAAAMAARVPTEDDVPAESLRRLLEELGHQGVAAVDIPTRLTEAFAAMKAAAAQPAERSNVGMDIDATIAKARERLDALDPQGALAVLDGKQAEVAELRTDATQREIALLAEKAKIQRLSLDHKAALATLGGIVELDAENDWALIETGDIHLLLGRSSDAKSAFERAFAIA